MKNIVFLTPGIKVGGAERQLALLAHGLKARNYNPSIISLSSADNYLQDFDGLNVHICPLQAGLAFFPSFFRLRQKLRELNPDIVQGWMYAGNLFASLSAIGLGKPTIFHSLRASNMDAGRYALHIRVNGWLSKFTKAVIVNSKAGLAFHLKQGFTAEKLTFIPNGVDIKTFDADPNIRQKIRKRFKFTETDRVVLYAARLDPMKAHDAVMAAAAQCPEIHFIFVGRGTQNLKTPPNITCLGVWENMSELYNAADLLINLSKFGEGFPNVIGEAMACNLRVLANDVGDSAFIMGDTGYICATLDAELVSRQITTIFSSLESVDGLPAPRQRILESFSVETMIDAYTQLYKD